MRSAPAGWLLIFMIAPAWAADYTLTPEKSAIKFFAIQNNAPIEGAFKQFTADIRFDAAHPENSLIRVEVDTGSVSVNYQEAEATLKLPQWLAVEAFPKAVYTGRKVTRLPMSDNYYAAGELELKGRKLPVTLNFQLKETGGVAIATGHATLQRTDYNVGEGEWAGDDVVKKAVRIEFRIHARKN